jgi:protein required for attachment to host cells
MAQNLFALVMDRRRARLLRVLGRGNGGCRLETFRLSDSRGVKRWLGEGSPNVTDAKVEQIGDDPDRIRALLHSDALEFVQEIVEELTALARSGQLDQLVIFAEPQIMPLLKRELPPSFVDRLLFTHEMSIVHLTEDQLLDTVLDLIDEWD